MKKTFYLLLLVCMIVMLAIGASFPTYAATSGRVGNCQWTLDGTVLSVNGTGALNVDYGNAPWGKSITEVKINEGITSISAGAFADCDALYKVILPSSLKAIEYGAFSNCTALCSITIPSGLTTIGNYAFSSCYSLIDITIPKTVTHIGIEVFQECYSLNNIFVDSANSAFRSIGGVLFSKDMSVLIRYPCDKSGQTYTVPNDVKEISMGAFEAAWNLLDITLHDGITKIGLNAFYKTVPYNDSSKVYGGCFYLGNHLIVAKNKDMTTCTVQIDTKTIADGAFMSWHSLQKVTLCEGLLSIGENAFAWCDSLKSIYIPKSVTKIGNHAFYDCNAMESVSYSGSVSDRSKIMIGATQNASLTNSSWEYNTCHGGQDHNFKLEVTTKNATCTEVGEKRLICTVCRYFETIELPALGHVYSPWTVEVEASCDDVGVEKRTCALCQELEAQNIEPKGHHYQEWSVDTDPTCTEEGLEKRICSDCALFETRVLPALGHSYGEPEVVKEPTLTETGLEEAVCENCGDVKTTSIDKTAPKGSIICICIVAGVALIAVVAVCVIIKKKRANLPKTQN